MSEGISAPGIYAMSAADYLADPCPAPSLSASIANMLLTYSPLHAWWNHPRLNPEFKREETERFDLGRACHAHLLEGETEFAIIGAEDWRGKRAQDQRHLARIAGKIPLLTEQWERVQAMATAARGWLLVQQTPRPLSGGMPERTLIWREGTVWCRSRLDWVHDDFETIDDYKTTDGSANPDVFSRRLFQLGYDVQAAFYLRGLKAVLGHSTEMPAGHYLSLGHTMFRFVVQETFPPYALSLIGLTPEALILAEKKVLLALEIWADCLARDRWPAYPRRICYASLPAWMETQWLERELRPQDADDGRPIGDLLTGMGEITSR